MNRCIAALRALLTDPLPWGVFAVTAPLLLALTACGFDGDPTVGPPRPAEVPTVQLTRAVVVDGTSGYPDAYTGCLPGTSVRLVLGSAGYYSGLDVAAVTDPSCAQ